MTTKLSGGPNGPESSSAPAETQRPRRRLGGWQLGGDQHEASLGATAASMTVPLGEPAGETEVSEAAWTSPLPMNRGTRTVEMDGSASTAALGDTAPVTIAEPVAEESVPLPSRTAQIGSFTERLLTSSVPGLTDQLAGGNRLAAEATVPLIRTTVPTVTATVSLDIDATVAAAAVPFDTPTSDLLGATAPFEGGAVRIGRPGQPAATATAQIALATAPMTASTAPATAPMVIPAATTRISAPEHATTTIAATASPAGSEIGTELSAAARAEIERLRNRISANSEDSDALFELSVILHRAGQRGEARTVLTKLVSVYEKRGQHQQAARIKTMLGAPKTGPITTEDLPPRPEDTSRTNALSGRTNALATRSMPASARTDPLAGRTMALQNPTAAIGRAKEQARAKSANVHAFPPEGMLFTVPLPGQERLAKEARDILKTSEVELEQKHYLAAFDSCMEVIALAPDYTPVFLRLAEIYTRQRLMRRARAQADALIRLANANNGQLALWMIYRVLLHASGGDTTSLKRLVELLIEAGQTEQASIYASRLVQILDAEGLHEEALDYSIRLCELVPGDTRAALENAILRLKSGDRGGALDRWEAAVAAGANSVVAKASVAAMTTATNEDDHWRILSEVLPVIRLRHDPTVVDAYVRTASVMPESPTLIAGHGLMLIEVGDPGGRDLLAQAAGARSGAPISRASAAVALAWNLAQDNRIDEYVAAVRTALKLLQNESVANHPVWDRLVGRTPRFVDLSLELGETLLARGDAAGAAEVLKDAHERSRNHGPVCERLAESYFKTGQLGSALTVLDELAVHYRTTGQLEAMARVLRQMSQLAPNNIKVKSRLIEAYLQRGFVAEARAELVQRADLEERSGLIKDAVNSLQRAADLSWTIGLADETFSLYARVVALAPDDVGNRSSLVNYYLQMGRLSEAAEHQRAVVDIALRRNHKHEAIAALHQVIGLTPDDANAYYQLGDLLASMGEFHQAEKVYRRLVLMNPSDPIAQAKATSMAALRESQAK